eukprot:757291-Hanusia_phi.AAC.7
MHLGLGVGSEGQAVERLLACLSPHPLRTSHPHAQRHEGTQELEDGITCVCESLESSELSEPEGERGELVLREIEAGEGREQPQEERERRMKLILPQGEPCEIGEQPADAVGQASDRVV